MYWEGDERVNRIWMALVLMSACFALAAGRGGDAAQALLMSGSEAVSLMLTLLGTMTLWSGLMEILHEAGDVARLSRVLRRIGGGLFHGLQDEESWEAMSLNVTANLLGLGNAATPAGVRAAQLLAAQGECGLRALAMLLVLNNTGLTLLPTTVITLRQAAGSQDAAGVWLPSLAVSFIATGVGAAVMMLLNRRHGACRD